MAAVADGVALDEGRGVGTVDVGIMGIAPILDHTMLQKSGAIIGLIVENNPLPVSSGR